MTLFGENYNSAEFMLGLITRAEHCAVKLVEKINYNSTFCLKKENK